MSILDKGIFVFYGFVDLTPEQVDYIVKKLGYKNRNDFESKSIYESANFGVKYYEDIPVRSGEYAETYCIGVTVNNPSEKIALIDQVPDVAKTKLQDIFECFRRDHMYCEHVPTSFGLSILYDQYMD